MMSLNEAIRYMRANLQYAKIVCDNYLGADVLESAERFQGSAEFSEVQKLIGPHIRGGTILDLGAGTGIASRAFAKSGARLVYALEPDPSNEVGYGAMRRLATGLPINLIDAYGEQIPLLDGEVDVVYARQVLHHTTNLPLVLRECARVLRTEGMFLACREHVADDEQQLQAFLSTHPVHQLAGGENAYRLDEYTEAIRSSGLELVKIIGPLDSVINAFPAVRTTEELERLPQTVLREHFGWVGALASKVSGVNSLVWRQLKHRPMPGRAYSFLAVKP
jgi:SAM-dependent methyltransferase